MKRDVPLYNIYNFATCPIERLTEEGKGMKIRELFRLPVFWLATLLMVCVGACENSMGQWASAFAEAALGFTKTVGDLVGPSLIGTVSQKAGNNLQAGMLAGCVFPLVLIVALILLNRKAADQ